LQFRLDGTEVTAYDFGVGVSLSWTLLVVDEMDEDKNTEIYRPDAGPRSKIKGMLHGFLLKRC
jgi:hypothetical protein